VNTEFRSGADGAGTELQPSDRRNFVVFIERTPSQLNAGTTLNSTSSAHLASKGINEKRVSLRSR
jgi:hypothetical protein